MFTTWVHGELTEIHEQFDRERVEPCMTGFDDVLRAALDANAPVIRRMRHHHYLKEKEDAE